MPLNEDQPVKTAQQSDAVAQAEPIDPLIILQKNNCVATEVSFIGQMTDVLIYRIAGKDYLVNPADKLGTGGSAVVYKAYPMENQKVNMEHPVALKICTRPASIEQAQYEEMLSIELKILALLFKDVSEKSDVVLPDNTVCQAFTMEYFEAKPLSDPKVFETLSKLTFTQRVLLILQGALFLNLFHHGMSEPIFHGDINPANSLISLLLTQEGIPVINQFLTDFGVARILKSLGLEDITGDVGARSTMAPEVLDGKAGIKSDVYSYVSIMLMLLGVANPVLGVIDHKVSNYNMVGFLQDLALPTDTAQTQADIAVLITKFVFRMMSKNYNLRAETNELVAFSQSLYTLCLLNDKKQIIQQLIDFKDIHLKLLQAFSAEQIQQLNESACNKVKRFSINPEQEAVIGKLSTEQFKAIIQIPFTHLQSYHTALKEKNENMTSLATKLTPEQITAVKALNKEDIDNLLTLTPEQIAILILYNEKQYSVLKRATHTEIKKLSELPLFSLIKLQLPLDEILKNREFETQALQEKFSRLASNEGTARLNNFNTLNTILAETDKEFYPFITAQLKERACEIAKDMKVLQTKMAVLTAHSEKAKDENTHKIRLKIISTFDFDNNPEKCELIVALTLTNKKRFLLANNEPDIIKDKVAKLIEKNDEGDLLTLKNLAQLCDPMVDKERVKLLLTLHRAHDLSLPFVEFFLFSTNNDFVNKVASLINQISTNMSAFKNSKKLELINAYLSNIIMKEQSRSIAQRFDVGFMPPAKSNKKRILELLEEMLPSPQEKSVQANLN